MTNARDGFLHAAVPGVRVLFRELDKKDLSTEDRAMLAEFMEFDRKMIYEKYMEVVEKLEG